MVALDWHSILFLLHVHFVLQASKPVALRWRILFLNKAAAPGRMLVGSNALHYEQPLLTWKRAGASPGF